MSHQTAKTLPNIARLKLEAIFHPKFENETPDSDIRQKMLAKVASGEGYLEASLKHSGSLLLWSGRQCFYSKNSTNNIFTHVGEIMLMQHFARCFGDNWREEYERCSEFVYENRITCSFESVTSILGHHGDLPNRDYLILIAVADRSCGRGRFYATNELVKFAQKFRLPHNDAWIFCSGAACESLFHSYDTMWETGTASTVIKKLDQIVSDNDGGECAKVSSLYPHDVFQGEILEGIVIRYVPYASSSSGGDVMLDNCNARRRDLREMECLSAASNELLRLVPPSMSLDTHSTTPAENLDAGTIQRVDLKALASMDDFEQQVENVLRSIHGSNFREIQRWNSPSDGETASATNRINMVEIAKGILSLSSINAIYDRETLDIAELIQSLDHLEIDLSYKVLAENSGSQARYLCILHIHQDSSFPKYNRFLRREDSDGMMLFRGFSIELVHTDDSNCNNNRHAKAASRKKRRTTKETNVPLGAMDLNHASEEKLMLKMKFLPYMVRTFICRNGLPILQRSGVAGFEEYAMRQLTRWQVSDASVRKWMPFFQGWAEYCSSLPDTALPPLSGNAYLFHYNEFDELFASGNTKFSHSDEPSFHGLIVIVGPTKRNLEALSLGVAKELHCSKIVRDVNQLTTKDVLLSMQRTGGGLVCIAEIEDGFGRLRKLAKKNHEALYIIMVEGDLDEFSADKNRLNKIKGMSKGWRKAKCSMLLDLSKDATNQKDGDTTLEYLRTNDSAKTVMTKLKESSNNNRSDDERPGLIVYFPSIPGSGKTSLCQAITSNSLDMDASRQLVLMEGDQVKKARGKFYNVVQEEILTKPASVAILDKNVPPSSFSSVHTLCIESKSIAIPVLFEGMRDTVVGNGESSHVYPFSLEQLAVFISRVLGRQPNTHKGKLDWATEDACMVVVKFYCFYRNMSVSALKEKLLSIGYRGKEIIIPLFREKMLPDFPTDLRLALEDAIVLQTRQDMNSCKADERDVATMERRLRSSIHSNQSFIDNLTVSLEESKRIFMSELSIVIASLPDKLDPKTSSTESKVGMIKIASLDLNYDEVHSEIEKLQKSSPEVEKYFAERVEDKNNDENDKSQNRFITSVHCTFAHASQVSHATMISTFQHLLGSSLEVKAISMLFSDEIAAVELEIPSLPSIPRPQNNFPHITIWCAKDIEPHRSNDLPEKVRCNDAKRITFEQPVVMSGIFSFWYQ